VLVVTVLLSTTSERVTDMLEFKDIEEALSEGEVEATVGTVESSLKA
jgi:hypothetical protein